MSEQAPGSIVVDPALSEPVDPLIGQAIGGYQVVSRIGAGGMGAVYAAQHQRIGRKAAVKVLQTTAAADAEWHKRFLMEAEALASLKHRNLVDVYEFGDLPDGQQYLMMEFLEGESLERYIQKHAPLMPAQALGFAEQILNGLGEAHKKGIVHRDLKPANVMLLREHNGELLVKLLDFGLARQNAVPLASLGDQQRTDAASLAAGTPEYISPEQAQAQQVDGTADLYSLGVMLFEMLSGRLPFESTSVTELLQKHLSERPPTLSTIVQGVPEGIEEFVASLLEKDPLARPQSADVARQQVQRLLKRLAAEATMVRPRPLAPTEKELRLAAKTDLVQRPVKPVLEAHSPTTDLSLKPADPKRRGVVAAVVGVLVLLGLWAVLPLPAERGEGRGEGPEVVKPAEVVKPPEVKPPEVVQQPEAVVDAGALAVAVPPEVVKPPEPKLVVKTPKEPAKVVVTAPPRCTFDERFLDWARDQKAQLRELPEAKLPAFGDAQERLERSLAGKDCTAANAAIAELKRIAHVED